MASAHLKLDDIKCPIFQRKWQGWKFLLDESNTFDELEYHLNTSQIDSADWGDEEEDQDDSDIVTLW